MDVMASPLDAGADAYLVVSHTLEAARRTVAADIGVVLAAGRGGIVRTKIK